MYFLSVLSRKYDFNEVVPAVRRNFCINWQMDNFTFFKSCQVHFDAAVQGVIGLSSPHLVKQKIHDIQ